MHPDASAVQVCSAGAARPGEAVAGAALAPPGATHAGLGMTVTGQSGRSLAPDAGTAAGAGVSFAAAAAPTGASVAALIG